MKTETEISKATESEVQIIADLARRIWHTAYAKMLSQGQIDLMLSNIYTPEALTLAMRDGQDFFLLRVDGESVGFMGIRRKDVVTLRVEKLYVLTDRQRRGLGRMLLNVAEHQARILACSIIELNVNRRNPAKEFYVRQGFRIMEQVDIPYHGYVLDDYIMAKSV